MDVNESIFPGPIIFPITINFQLFFLSDYIAEGYSQVWFKDCNSFIDPLKFFRGDKIKNTGFFSID